VISQVAVYEDAVHQAVVQHEQEFTVEQQGFTTEDILWALGIWSVILCMSPVIVFYLLMVA
jgi:predicted solute-binding protein